MKRKAIFLSLVFILPVIVFVFLKMFGKNEFEIPVFHSKKVAAVSGCNDGFAVPYTLPDSILYSIGWKNAEATLILFSTMEKEGIMRLKERYSSTKLHIITMSENDLKRLRCPFLLPDKFGSVLVDNKRQIRGYYQLTTREETDRLLVELSILLKEY
jgi:hypothetical protein